MFRIGAKCYRFIFFLVLVAIIAGIFPLSINIKGAENFNIFYLNLMITFICICSALFTGKSIRSFLITTTLTGAVCAIVSSAVFQKLDKANPYFAFESNLTFSGFGGLVEILLAFVVAEVLALQLWFIKKWWLNNYSNKSQ